MTIPSSLERINQGNIRTSEGHIVIKDVGLVRIQLITIVGKRVRLNETEKAGEWRGIRKGKTKIKAWN
jgi:hypothetical protein